MTVREWLPLISIVVSVFIFNMSEFVPIGLLTGISDDFGISESSAGMIISVYAWAVAILSLPIMLVLRRMEYRRMMLMCVTLFVVFQFMSGISSSYGMLIVSRLGVALSHAVFWSIAPPLAVKIVSREHQKLALSMVAAGTSIAMIVGLPLGRVIGLAMGWRMTFVAIAAVSVVVLVLLALVFPRVENPGTFTLKRVPEIFHNRVLVTIYIVLAVYVTGCYTGYSYIEPFLEQVAHMDELTITLVLIVFGGAGFIGSALFTKTYDRLRFRFLVFAFGGVASALVLLNFGAGYAVLVFALCIIWGMCHTCFNVSFQNETIWVSPSDASAITMSLFSGIYNVGIAMGPIVGGLVIDNMSISDIGFVGGLCCFAAMAILVLVLIPQLRKDSHLR